MCFTHPLHILRKQDLPAGLTSFEFRAISSWSCHAVRANCCIKWHLLWANRTFSRQFCAYWKKTPAVSQLLKTCLTAKKATVLKLQRFEEYLSLIQDGGPYMVKFYCAPPWHIQYTQFISGYCHFNFLFFLLRKSWMTLIKTIITIYAPVNIMATCIIFSGGQA